MKLLIFTFGSLGDVQPFVALGTGLRAAGHQVAICTATRFAPFIRSHGLIYGHMTDELLSLLLGTQQGRKAIENTDSLFGVLNTMAKLLKQTRPIYQKMMGNAWETAQTFCPDIILSHPKVLGAAHMAERLGVPFILTMLQPMLVPTGTAPSIGFPDLKLGPGYNRLTHQLLQRGLLLYGGLVKQFRREVLKLDPPRHRSAILTGPDGSPIPVLFGHSPNVAPRPLDWPEHVTICGYWFLEATDPWTPPPKLQAFLDGGDPPIYFGFGSMAGKHPQRLAQTVCKALQQTGLRGIIATGWGGLNPEALPASIFKIESVPHDWLFDRVSAVVHHGGAGTTAAGLKAGKPTLICPFLGDQPFWGERIHALGAGPKPIPQKKLTEKRLVHAITALTQTPGMQAAATGLKATLTQEDGIQTAIDCIEKMVATG